MSDNTTSLVLSIVIVSWNVRRLLTKCLDSISRQSLSFPYEIIIIDNNSADDSVAWVRENYPDIHLIASEENLGYAVANNIGLKSSAGGYVLLLNPDTEVEAGAIEALINFLDEHEEVGAVGPNLLNPDRTRQDSCYPIPNLRREFLRMFHLDSIYHYGTYDQYRWNSDTPRQVDAIKGACLMIRRKAAEPLDWLDEHYYMYTEEIDLCYRLKQYGWKLFWLPRANVIHYGGQSTYQVADKMFLQLYSSKVYFFRKHYGADSAKVLKRIFYVASIIRIIILSFLMLLPGKKRIKNKNLLQKYKLLIQNLPRL